MTKQDSRLLASRLFLHPCFDGIAGEWRTILLYSSTAVAFSAAPGPLADLPGYNSYRPTAMALLQYSIGGTWPNWIPKKSVPLHQQHYSHHPRVAEFSQLQSAVIQIMANVPGTPTV